MIQVPEIIGGALAVLAGIAVLVVRYRRRDRLIAFMPLLPIGYGLMVIGVLIALRVSSAWIEATVVGSIILAARRVPLSLFATGRISKQQAALLYAAILPVALIVISLVGPSFWSWPTMAVAALMFLVSYGTALGAFTLLRVGSADDKSPARRPD